MSTIIGDLDVRLVKMNECFLGFTYDLDVKINRLTALCGELLRATCVLYDCVGCGLLCALGQWSTPPDFNPVDDTNSCEPRNP